MIHKSGCEWYMHKSICDTFKIHEENREKVGHPLHEVLQFYSAGKKDWNRQEMIAVVVFLLMKFDKLVCLSGMTTNLNYNKQEYLFIQS